MSLGMPRDTARRVESGDQLSEDSYAAANRRRNPVPSGWTIETLSGAAPTTAIQRPSGDHATLAVAYGTTTRLRRVPEAVAV
jgi:hypothetical protein